MNEKKQYLEMLEIPTSTCNLTFEKPSKPSKRKKKINHEKLKESLVEKVNSSNEPLDLDDEKSQEISLLNEQLSLPIENEPNQEIEQLTTPLEVYDERADENAQNQDDVIQTASVSVEKKTNKKRWRLTTIGVQFSVICVLILTIFVTNAVYADSGINVFLRSVFGASNSAVVDNREFSEFKPVINVDEGAAITVSNGVMTISGTGSVYPTVNGKVSSVVKGDDGLYSIEITHSSSFKSLISGLEHAYVGLEDSVYYNIPVGYTSDGEVSLCFLGADGSVISDYQVEDNSVIWAV